MQTRLTEFLGISVPIVLAPMGPWADDRLAAAVSNAGGLGTVGAWAAMGVTEKKVREFIKGVRAATDKPFGAGFATQHIPVCRGHFDAVLEERVPVVLLSFDDPTPWIPSIHDAGSKVICQVQTLDGARQAVDAGTDVLCVQGTEAGGHTGRESLFPLLIQTLEHFPETPTIASGGLSSGRALAAVLAAGADGAWIGTALLASLEAQFQPGLAEAIVASDGRDTIRSTTVDVVIAASGPPRPAWPDGIAPRIRRNAITDRWHGREAEFADDHAAVQSYIERLGRRDPDVFPMLYGQGAGSVTRIAPVAEIIAELIAGARSRLQLGSDALR